MYKQLHNLLFYRAGACNELRVSDYLDKIAERVIVITEKCVNKDVDALLAEKLFLSIHEYKVEVIFSVDYYPIIAEVAHVVGIPYVSWVFDSPHYTLYSTTSKYDSTFIFVFDREECERLRNMGRDQVYHQPLASDPYWFRNTISYSPDMGDLGVSFLGSLYQNEYDYLERAKGFTDYERGFFEAMMKAQSDIYGASIIEQAVSEQMADRILSECDIHMPKTYDIPKELVAANVLEKKISVIDRKSIVQSIAENFGITLYSDKEPAGIKGIDFKGYADYETEMPLVFRYSRINLNPTLRSIHSGIPLRALDIIACGGFLLSNYQPELAEWFDDGESIAMYGSIEEMMDKIDHYLKHDDERKKIIERGYKIVSDHFTYEHALENIFGNVYFGR